jgi:hypothetical protein
MYRQEDQDSKWFTTPAMATNMKKANIDRRRAAAAEELHCYGQPIHFVFILVDFSSVFTQVSFSFADGANLLYGFFLGGVGRKVWKEVITFVIMIY